MTTHNVDTDAGVCKADVDFINALADSAERHRDYYLETDIWDVICEPLRILHGDIVGDDPIEFRDRALADLRAGGGPVWAALGTDLQAAIEAAAPLVLWEEDVDFWRALRDQAARDDDAAVEVRRAELAAEWREIYEKGHGATAREEARTLAHDIPAQTAERLLAAHWESVDGQLLRHYQGSFYRWTGSHYEVVPADEMRSAVRKRLKDAEVIKVARGKGDVEDTEERVPFVSNDKRISEILSAIRDETILPAALKAPRWLDRSRCGPNPNTAVTCSNGALDTRTGVLFPPTPDWFTLNALPYAYDPRAPEPKAWLKFLSEVLPNDQDAIACLQEMFGVMVTQDTSHQKIWMLVGTARGGKGTIARVLEAVVGEANRCNPTLKQLSADFGTQPLIGKQLAIISDANLSRTTDAGVVTESLKAISGEDSRTVNRKNKEMWTGRLTTRFVILSNDLPKLSDPSGALAKRLIVFRFDQSFYGREDPHLTGALLNELPGILRWALDGLARVSSRGRLVQPASGRDTLEEMADLTSPVRVFMRDRCALDPAGKVSCSEAFDAWRIWCMAQGRKEPGTAQSFGNDLKSATPGVTRKQVRVRGGGPVWHYLGIRLEACGGSVET